MLEDFVVLGLVPGTDMSIGFTGSMLFLLMVFWIILMKLGTVKTPVIVTRNYHRAIKVYKKIVSSKQAKLACFKARKLNKSAKKEWLHVKKVALKKINTNKTILAFRHLFQGLHSGHTG